MKPQALSLAICVAACLLACPPSPQPPAELPEVKLRQEWFANANFAGAILAAEEFAADHGIRLTVEEGSESIDPIKLVAAGHSDFGDASADRVLAAIEQGVPLTIVGVVNPSSPTVFLAKREKSIRTPKDFEGHTVGVLTGTATEYVYRALLEKENVDLSKVKEIEAGFDLQGFITDTYEVRPAFAYDEPVSLEKQGIEFTTIDPRDYGIDFIGTVYFTRSTMIQNKRDLVESFVYSIADGWRLALENPDRAVQALKAVYPQIDVERETRSLSLARDFIISPPRKILKAETKDWAGTFSALRSMGAIKKIELKDLDSFVNNEFIDAYHNSEGAQ